ncbi:MAG TPA: glycosyltransferase family 2 protein [Dongiaceae bacterium]|nr:glycosyltransferase family 2 protein [Dongiaceae bacterium]
MTVAGKGQSSGPRVSIGLPVYNAERYLPETLDSVLRQTYSDFVLYIADNASSDGTQEICRDYASRDSRIQYIRNQTNIGAAANYTRCFTPATSEYFRWQNADDTIEPTLIEQCIQVLDNQPDVILAYGKTHLIDENSQFTRAYDDRLHLPQESAAKRFIACINNIDLQHLMYGLIRRKVLEHTALLKPYVSSDINFICELALYGKFTEIPEHLFNRRMHAKAGSWDMDDKERQKNHWDPSKRRLVMQVWRSLFEHYEALYKAPIPFGEKRIIGYYLLKCAYWQKDMLWRELKELGRSG